MEDGREHKVLVIGPPKAGKTAFIARYVHDIFYAGEPYKQTFGVDFSLKHLKWKNGENVTLQLWDIAGQERTQTMSRMYYQDAHACIIMFDMTYGRSLEICKKWKDDLDSKCTLEDGFPVPCLLIANKSDLADRRQFSSDQIAKFAKDNKFVGYMETSVKTNKNVTESMDFLVDHLMSREYADVGLGDEGVDLLNSSSSSSDKCSC